MDDNTGMRVTLGLGEGVVPEFVLFPSNLEVQIPVGHVKSDSFRATSANIDWEEDKALLDGWQAGPTECLII